jgi:hypothetical protein
MAKKKESVGQYMEVWGDTVVPKELAASAVICIFTSMAFFLAGRAFFLSFETLDPALAKGYALLVGIVGTFVGAFISGAKFRPKRRIMIDSNTEDIEEILKAAGMTVEEEREALRTVSPEIIREMENFELYSLLALIPEDSPNYKPEYREKAQFTAQKNTEEA